MAQKSALKRRPEPRKPKDLPKPSDLPKFDEPVEELTGAEKFVESLKPHITTIALLALAVVLGVIAIAMWSSTSFQNNAFKWQEFTQSNFIDLQTNDTKNLDGVASQYPDDKAGLYSALLSGDIQLRKGLAMLGQDREGGLTAIRKAKNSFQMVVDAKDSAKNQLLSQRSQYCLAYAHESLGELGKAKALYQEFVDAAPEAALAESARRGVQRCGNEDMAKLFNTFVNFEDEVIGEAPGPSIPEKVTPGDFPEIDAEAGVVPPTGDETDTRMNADEVAEEKAKAEAAAKAKQEAEAKAKKDAEKKAAESEGEKTEGENGEGGDKDASETESKDDSKDEKKPEGS